MVNKYAAADWVKKIIISCENHYQLQTARRLINNHLTMFNDSYLHKYLNKVESTQFWKINDKQCNPLTT